jgi:hypothetical protein
MAVDICRKARPHHAHASCGVNRCASARPGGALAGQPCLRLTTSSAGASRTSVLGMCLTFPPLTTTSCTSNWSATQKLAACLGVPRAMLWVGSGSSGWRYGVSAKLASHVASDIVSRRSRHGVSRHRPYAQESLTSLPSPAPLPHFVSPGTQCQRRPSPHLFLLLKRPCLSSPFLHPPIQVLHPATRLHPNPCTSTNLSPSPLLQWAVAPTTPTQSASTALAN